MNASVVTTMLRALLRWWWLIVLSVSLGVGVGYLLRTEQIDLYYSQATVRIASDRNPGGTAGADARELDAYTVLVRRSNLLQPVIDDLGLNISVVDLLNRLNVSTNQSASLLSMGIVDTDPERAAVIANQIADELIRQTSDRGTLLDLEFISNQINDIQRQITDLQSQYDQLVQDASTLTSAFDLTTNLNQRSQIEQAIGNLRTILLDLVDNAPRSNIQIFEPASANYDPMISNSWLDLAIAGAAGGVLSTILIILFTFFDDRLQWKEGGQELVLGQKVLGPLGIIPNSKLPLYVETMPHSVETEALRQVRAKIALTAGGKHPRVLTIMSYDSSEGKTVTSANLALDTALSGLRTLVIDGDMRRGDVHEIFHLPNVFGLSDILHSRERLQDLLAQAVLDSGYENLAILPSGRAPVDPAAMLGRPRLAELIDMLTDYYDAIIIDSAPTIGGPDGIFLSEVSDGVLIVVNTRRTRLASLKQAIDELNSGQNIQIYGLVFNRVRLQVTTKYNNSYYRQSPTLTPEKLSREMARPGSGIFGLRRHIITDSKGELLYSVSACAARLGVKRRTVHSWIDSGHIQTERRLLRQWIRESTVTVLLQQRMVAPIAQTESINEAMEKPASAVNGNHEIPNQLREKREAILGYASRSDRPDQQI